LRDCSLWLGRLTLLNELKNKGVEDVLIFAINGLNGFNEAIKAVYSKTEILLLAVM